MYCNKLSPHSLRVTFQLSKLSFLPYFKPQPQRRKYFRLFISHSYRWLLEQIQWCWVFRGAINNQINSEYFNGMKNNTSWLWIWEDYEYHHVQFVDQCRPGMEECTFGLVFTMMMQNITINRGLENPTKVVPYSLYKRGLEYKNACETCIEKGHGNLVHNKDA